MKHYILFGLLGVIFLFVSCKKDDKNPVSIEYGSIQGKVTNASGDSIIINANVSTNPPTSSVTTDSRGEYIINNVPEGNYIVTATKSGYQPGSVSVKVNPGKTTIANIQMSVITSGGLPTEGLIAYYPFNGNANDESGNGYHGIVKGATLTTDRFGNANKAYSFTNNVNYIQVNNFPLLNRVFTYCAWIKPSPSNLVSGQNFGCYGTIGGGASSWDAGYYINNQLAIYDSYNLVLSYVIELANNWHFISIVYNGNTRSIYVDGQYKTSQNIRTPFATRTTDIFRIGMHTSGDGDQQFIGAIDDIRVYNRALSENEILQLYREGGWR